MNVLDSPVEALAFKVNYLSFGSLTLLNILWTWLALISAALSFWKIRSANCPKPIPEPEPQTTSRTDPVVEVLTLAPHAVTLTALTEPPQDKVAVGNGVEEEFDGVRKGKFSVYYEEDEVQCRCGEEEEELLTMTVTEEWKEESEWWKRWEMLLRLRNGENEKGWYTCQDLTALNGNVVRLWDGGLTFGTSGAGTFTRESWYSSSSCIHVW